MAELVPPARDERFESLFRESYAAVRGYALRRAAPEAAQDVVGETFLVAWRRLDDVPDDALPWLYGVASPRAASCCAWHWAGSPRTAVRH